MQRARRAGLNEREAPGKVHN